jgi:hypothetical protein
LAARANFLLLQTGNESRLALLLGLELLFRHPSLEGDFAIRLAVKEFKRPAGKFALPKVPAQTFDLYLVDFEGSEVFFSVISTETSQLSISQFSIDGHRRFEIEVTEVPQMMLLAQSNQSIIAGYSSGNVIVRRGHAGTLIDQINLQEPIVGLALNLVETQLAVITRSSIAASGL